MIASNSQQQNAVDRILHWRHEALCAADAGNDDNALAWMLMAKATAMEARLAELYCECVSDVYLIRERINKRLKSQGLPTAPLYTFPAANMSDKEILNVRTRGQLP